MPFQEGNEHGKENRFQPGQSGNPAGYPPGVPNRATVLRKWLEKQHTFEDPTTGKQITATVEDAVALGLISKAISGDTAAAKEIFDTLYGKQTEKLELETKKKVVVKIGGRISTAPANGSSGD